MRKIEQEMTVIFCKTENDAVRVLEETTGGAYYLPERHLDTYSLLEWNEPPENLKVIITTSPFVVANYGRHCVTVYNNQGYAPVDFETYGCDINILIKRLFERRSTLPRKVVNDIRDKLKESDTLPYIESLGDSAEKAYLLRKLKEEQVEQ